MKRALALAIAGLLMAAGTAHAAPSVLDRNLEVVTAVGGLDQPISIAFLGDDDMFVLEKASGKVKHIPCSRAMVAACCAVKCP